MNWFFFCRKRLAIFLNSDKIIQMRGIKVMKKENTIDMVNGPLLKNIMIFAVPLMFTNFLQILFNAADTVVVGKFAGGGQQVPLFFY